MAELDPEIQDMLERHYRNEFGVCNWCDADVEQEAQPWPCDAAILLRRMGYTVREDPLYVPPPRKPSRTDALAAAIPDIWSEETARIVARDPGYVAGFMAGFTPTRWVDDLPVKDAD